MKPFDQKQNHESFRLLLKQQFCNDNGANLGCNPPPTDFSGKTPMELIEIVGTKVIFRKKQISNT